MNARAERARAAGGASAGRDWLAAAGLAGLAAATRLPLAANAPGEADSARFLIGLEQWRRYGPGGHFIYGAVFSPGYYWLAAHWLRWFGIPIGDAAGALARLSAMAAVLSAPLIYFLGRGLLGRRAAVVAAALFLLTPGYWWLGIEAHPQQLSILLLLAAMVLLARGARMLQTGRPALPQMPMFLAAGVAWAAALLFKSDAVLLAPAMIALAAGARGQGDGRRGGEEAERRAGETPAPPAGESSTPRPLEGGGSAAGRAAVGVLVVAGGGGLFVLARQALLGARLGATQAEAARTLAQFWSWPGAKAAVRQAAPVLFAAGPIVWLWALTGMALAWWAARRIGTAEPRRLALLAAAWAVPIYGFWWVIRGNNARHVALAFLPLLWLGAWGWETWWQRWAARHWRRAANAEARAGLLAGLMVLGLVAVNAEAVPASSNITLFPSGDVPRSAAMLHAKEAVMRRWALRIERRGGCYFGCYTPPYLIADILAADPAARLARAGEATVVSDSGAALPDGARFFTITAAAQAGAVRRACPGAVSLEYGRRGQHLRFLGDEWAGLPLAGRFYGRP